MPEAVIVSTRRSPIGRAFKGSLIDVRPDDLAGFISKKLVDDLDGFDPIEIEDVICGSAIQAGEQSMNIGKVVAALAGFPDEVAGSSVNRFCASSLQSIRTASHAIQAGEGDAFLAVGVESVSRTGGRAFDPAKDSNPRFTEPTRDDYVNDHYISMGLTAENVADRWGISREDMDEYAALSQNRAVAAQESGFFAEEITPVPLPDGTIVTSDDGPRPGTTVESLSGLKPVFREDGRVTAGNSCPLNDGAAAALVMSDTRANELGLTPRARIISSAVTGCAPEMMGIGPISAIELALKRAGMTISDIDIVELNEAFAAQVLPICSEVGIDIDSQLNPHGGAIALGHPFGMTGIRIMTTLLHELEAFDKSIGLETMCVGGGQGMAMVVERIS
ncbi:MAG: acetyl-CoA C-acyltransferase [Actinomycetota bacterium]|nr:acetyl-CoA C-acyltransferase [Actinomycetota bacterium]